MAFSVCARVHVRAQNTEKERKQQGTECKTHMVCERCESRAGTREWRAAETQLWEGTILGKTILGSKRRRIERKCSAPAR